MDLFKIVEQTDLAILGIIIGIIIDTAAKLIPQKYLKYNGIIALVFSEIAKKLKNSKK